MAWVEKYASGYRGRYLDRTGRKRTAGSAPTREAALALARAEEPKEPQPIRTRVRGRRWTAELGDPKSINSTSALTTEQLRKVISALRALRVSADCPLCRGRMVVAHRTETLPGTGVQSSADRLAVVYCTECGWVAMHKLGVLAPDAVTP